MTTWFTADLHFDHANIINYSGWPFADATAMNQALIERWNDSIHPDDTVWVLGDVALGRIDETLALVGELSGRKLLLAGNHDRYVEQRPVDHGEWLLHGHVHERWRQRGRMINVGVDAWGCRPVNESTLAALIDDGPNDREPLPLCRSHVGGGGAS